MDFDYIAPVPFDLLYELEIGLLTTFGSFKK